MSSRFSWSCNSYSRLPTNGRHNKPRAFLSWKGFCSFTDTADCRPAGGAQCCHPEFSNHRLALLPSALFVELLLRCQLGVLNWKRVLPSRTRTHVAVSSKLVPGACRSHPNSAIWIHISLKLPLSSVPAVTFDSAMVRTLHRLPTACEARFPTFAQLPQPLSSFLACRRVPPGAAPIA